MTNGGEEPQRAKLRATGLDGLFDATFFATPERGIKPDPRPFTTTLDALGVAPTAAVSVGDGYETDIRPAIELGMDTVWVTSRPDPDRETDYAVARPAELLQLPPLA